MDEPLTATACLAANDVYWKDQELSLALLDLKLRNAFLSDLLERAAAVVLAAKG